MAGSRCMCLAICTIGALLGSGCATGPYQYGRGWRNAQSAACTPPANAASLEVAVGRPHKFVDGVGWIVGIPGKVLLWDRRVNNHDISATTTETVAEYLEQNQLQDVCVRVNQYAPGDEWRRLCANREVGAGWRYTVGTLSVAGYTLFPGRVFGTDRYNPFTNSLYLYSDVPSLGMQAAAYAKDLHNRERPGTYAAVNELPIVALWHETIATRDALAYLQTQGDAEAFREGERILEPHYGSRVGGAFDFIVGFGPVFQVGGAIVGHVSGRMYPSAEPGLATGEPDWIRNPAETELVVPVSYDEAPEEASGVVHAVDASPAWWNE